MADQIKAPALEVPGRADRAKEIELSNMVFCRLEVKANA